MRVLLASAILSAVAVSPTSAQTTTSCQWIGNIWTCNQSAPPPQINWGTLRSPADAGSSVMESFRQGQEIGERARRARLERERLEAETELYRAQAEAVRGQGQPSAVASQAPATPDYISEWAAAARPRMGLYPDFEQKVFAPEVNITPDMVRLMTSSPLAADIAYYLATHRAEATAISTMPLLEAARAIDKIEAELKASAPRG